VRKVTGLIGIPPWNAYRGTQRVVFALKTSDFFLIVRELDNFTYVHNTTNAVLDGESTEIKTVYVPIVHAGGIIWSENYIFTPASCVHVIITHEWLIKK